MISTDSIQSIIGSTAYGPDGDKIGSIGQVYFDNHSGRPEWATVKTGLFGTKESFVPLHDATLTEDGGVLLPFEKDRVKGAPTIDADRDVTPEEETRLYEYYGLTWGTAAGTASGTAAGTAGYSSSRSEDAAFDRDRVDTSGVDTSGVDTSGVDTSAQGVTGYDTSGPTTDDAMTRSEERVHAGTESREAGRARLRKHVVTERQQVEVPVTREEVRLEREPITEANRGAAMSGPDLSEEEHEVVLNEERPVVHKETVPVERVRLAKDQVSDTERVDVDVRQERIDSDVDADLGTPRDR